MGVKIDKDIIITNYTGNLDDIVNAVPSYNQDSSAAQKIAYLAKYIYQKSQGQFDVVVNGWRIAGAATQPEPECITAWWVNEDGDDVPIPPIEHDGYCYWVFKTLSTVEVNGNYDADLLLIGSGGTGGDGFSSGVYCAGGGGAGGLVYIPNLSINPSDSGEIVIGGGGDSSVAFGKTAYGGGDGGTYNANGRVGASGGGAGSHPSNRQTEGGKAYDDESEPSVDPPQGKNGGDNKPTEISNGGAGGGGYKTPGVSFASNSANGQDGGKGCNINEDVFDVDGLAEALGVPNGVCGGGGGGGSTSGKATHGGGGGGGDNAPVVGQPNTGGGGGGGGRNVGTRTGAMGGTGLCIVRIAI